MSDPKYGSPDLDDATALLERQVNEAAQWVIQTSRTAAAKLLNRPMGTVPVKREDQLTDYVQVARNPQALAKIHQERMAQMGQKQGTVDFIRWVKAHEKRLNNGAK